MFVLLDERESWRGMGMVKFALGPLVLSCCIWAARSGRRGRNKGSARKWR